MKEMSQQEINEFHDHVDNLKDDHYPNMNKMYNLPIKDQVKVVHKMALRDFNKAIADSGKSRSVFIATESMASGMLYEWEVYRQAIKEDHNVECPELADGVTIKIN